MARCIYFYLAMLFSKLRVQDVDIIVTIQTASGSKFFKRITDSNLSCQLLLDEEKRNSQDPEQAERNEDAWKRMYILGLLAVFCISSLKRKH